MTRIVNDPTAEREHHPGGIDKELMDGWIDYLGDEALTVVASKDLDEYMSAVDAAFLAIAEGEDEVIIDLPMFKVISFNRTSCE
jgi:hypothetical protein